MFRKAVIAAIVGGTCGGVAGYWLQPAGTHVEPPAAAAPMAMPTRPVPRPPAPTASVPPPLPAKPQARTALASHQVEDPADAVQRARVLAQRPDVRGVVALREEVLRRAEEAGEEESPKTKRQLDEIDRYLTEARVLRLKLDAAEFRKGGADPVPPK